MQLIHPAEFVAAFPDQRVAARNPFTLHVTLSHRGVNHEMGLVPDFVFGLTLADSSRRHFTVEIDRGTMPVVRSDTFRQTSFEEKMRAYVTAHAAKQHERQFGWKTFRVLTVTTDRHRSRLQQLVHLLMCCNEFLPLGLEQIGVAGRHRQRAPSSVPCAAHAFSAASGPVVSRAAS